MKKMVTPEVHDVYRRLKPLMDETNDATSRVTRGLYKTLHQLPRNERVITVPVSKETPKYFTQSEVRRYVAGDDALGNVPVLLGGRGRITLSEYHKHATLERPIAGYVGLFAVAIALQYNRRFIDNHLLAHGPLPKLPGYRRLVTLEMHSSGRLNIFDPEVTASTKPELGKRIFRFIDRAAHDNPEEYRLSLAASYANNVAETALVAEGARMLHQVDGADGGLTALHRDWQTEGGMNFDDSLPVWALVTDLRNSYSRL